ncbi:putative non-specific serine/threonine protein kinase [Helianthus debilis subsp. tardiflorus]
MSSLQHVYLDYITFSSWVLPETLKSASSLRVFSATSANINGTIPDFFGRDFFSRLTTLHLDINSLEGGIPDSFFGSSIQSLRLNGQNSRSKLNGTLDVIESMIQLTEVWLHGNMFTGTLPDFSGLNELQTFSVRDNSLIGPVPESLTELRDRNRVLVSRLRSLQRLLLADNNLSGMIPDELKDLPILIELDVSNNQLYGRVPEFKQSVKVRTDGNVDIEKDGPSTTPVSPAGGRKGGDGGGGGKTRRVGGGRWFASVLVVYILILLLTLDKKKKKVII